MKPTRVRNGYKALLRNQTGRELIRRPSILVSQVSRKTKEPLLRGVWLPDEFEVYPTVLSILADHSPLV